MLLSLHPNIIVHVENIVSLFSSPSTAHKKYESVAAITFFLSYTVHKLCIYTHAHRRLGVCV